MSELVVIDADTWAAWLAKDAADVRWTVDGDDNLEAQLDLPCTGSELADAVRKHGGELLMLASPQEQGSQGTRGRDLGELAVKDARGARVFQLAWRSEPGRRWVVAEDVDMGPAVAVSR